MKKSPQYNKPLYLDTCVFNNIFNEADKNSNIDEQIEAKPLKNYIRHHGCYITVYSLYELLRQSENNSKSIIGTLSALLKKGDVTIRTSQHSKLNISSYDFACRIEDEEKRHAILCEISDEILDYASDFYSRVFLFPFAMGNYCLQRSPALKNVCQNRTLSHEIFKKAIHVLKTAIKKQYVELYRKSFSKTLDRINKHLDILSKKWFCDTMTPLFENPSESLYNETLTSILQMLENEDFGIDIVEENNRIYSNKTNNPLYWIITEIMPDVTDSSHHNSENITQLKNKIENIMREVYSTDNSPLINEYLTRALRQFFMRQISGSSSEHNFSRIVQPNDIIDYINLEYSEADNYVYLTTDKAVIQIIDKIYPSEKKNVFYDFIHHCKLRVD